MVNPVKENDMDEGYCVSCEIEGKRRVAITTRDDLSLCMSCALDWDAFSDEEQYDDWDGSF